MIRSSRRVSALIALGLGVSGCTVGPTFTPPRPDLPSSWRDASLERTSGSAISQTPVDPQWWRAFGDPVLNSLVERALAGNISARQTIARIAQARAQERAARATALPALKTSGTLTHEKIGEAQLLAGGGALFSKGLGDIGSLIKPLDLYQVNFDASWELDLFGKVRRQTEEAHAQTLEQVESRNDAIVSLEGEVVRAYLQLRANQNLLAAARDIIRDEARITALTRRQRQEGVATDLDVDQALGRQTRTEADAPQFEAAAEEAMNSLAILLGERPGALDAELAKASPLPAAPASIGVSLPSTLARRRPDIRRAEATLHAATAHVGVAVAELYPDLSLSAETGQQSLSAKTLANWSSNFYQFGPNISLPVFQGGRLRANVRLAKAREAEAALGYRQAVLNALEEVENALVALRTDREREARTAALLEISERKLLLARKQQEQGVQTFLAVLDAETSVVSAKEDLLRLRLQVGLDAAGLSKAVGGGWEAAPAATR